MPFGEIFGLELGFGGALQGAVEACSCLDLVPKNGVLDQMQITSHIWYVILRSLF